MFKRIVMNSYVQEDSNEMICTLYKRIIMNCYVQEESFLKDVYWLVHQGQGKLCSPGFNSNRNIFHQDII